MAKVQTVKSKGDVECVSCRKPIKDIIVQAMDQTWHQEHFVCAHCKEPIVSQRYHVYENQPYCERDYEMLFLKKCTACGQPIRDVVVMALGQPWHRDHFSCTSCGTTLSQKGFYEHESKPYCQSCYEKQFCPVCKACDKPIADTAVIALGDKYHTKCFKCSKCKEPVMDCTFKIVNGKQICSNCESEQ